MILMSFVGLWVVTIGSGSSSCPNLQMCSCSSEPLLTVNCSNRNLSFLYDMENLKGWSIDELILKDVSGNNWPEKYFDDIKMNKIDMSNNQIDNLDKILNKLDEDLKELRLDNCGIDVKFLHVLHRFSNLTLLSLRRNDLDIRNIPAATFVNFQNLEYLDLSYNRLSSCDDIKAFEKLDNLRYLNLKSTSFDLGNSRCVQFLRNLKSLECLNLGHNDNVAYQKPFGAIFSNLNLTSVRILNLESNNIRKMHDNAFDGIRNLQVLDLSNNSLPTVPAAVTSTLSNLTHLNISNNDIVYISDKTFENLTNLRYLSFRNNKIASFPRYAFKGLGDSLETLDLSSNKLTGGYFWISGLRQLRSIVKLNISYNYMKHIQNESFDYTPHIRELDVSGNPISFTDTMFSGIEFSLKELYVKDTGMKKVPLIPLQTLVSLDVLDLSRNMIKNLSSRFLHGTNVKNLYLQNMNISFISNDAFDGVKGPISVFVDSNNISSLNFLEEVTPCIFDTLSLLYNPLVCDCKAISVSASGRVGIIKGTCANEVFKDISLENISLNDINFIRACKHLHVVTGRCSRTGRFISNSTERLLTSTGSFFSNLIICLIYIKYIHLTNMYNV